ncbi:MAG: hypothetical protein ACYTGS_15640 [Planctomycetota bacterium]|jgi:hypothetical protein
MSSYYLTQAGIRKVTIKGKPQYDELVASIAQLAAKGYTLDRLASAEPKTIRLIASRFEYS